MSIQETFDAKLDFLKYFLIRSCIKCKAFSRADPTVFSTFTVINELDGLCKQTSRPDKYTGADTEHNKLVQAEASQAIEFLESEFDRRNTRLKALTVSGTELETITYRSEETSSIVSRSTVFVYCSL